MSFVAIGGFTPPPPPQPALGGLSMSNLSITESAIIGSVVGTLSGMTAGSTLSLPGNSGGLFALNGTNIEVAGALDNATNPTPGITVGETLAGSPNSPRLNSFNISVAAAGDVTPPSILTATPGAESGGLLPVTLDIDEASTVNWVLTSSVTVPTPAQVVASQDHTGAAGDDGGSFAAPVDGAYNVTLTSGLNGSYYLYLSPVDGSGNRSATVTQVGPLTLNTVVAGPLVYSSVAPTSDALIEGPFTVTFDQTVAANGSKNFYLKQGATTIETFDVSTGVGNAGGSLALVGSTVVITPGVTLQLWNTVYNIQWDADAVLASGGGSLAVNSSAAFCTFTSEVETPSRTLASAYMYRDAVAPVMGAGVSDGYHFGFYAKFNLSNNTSYKGFWSHVAGGLPTDFAMKNNEGVEFLIRGVSAADNHLPIVDNRSWAGAHEMWVTVDTLAGVVRYYVDGVDESGGATIITKTSKSMLRSGERFVFGALGGLASTYAGTIDKLAVWFPADATAFAALDPTTPAGRTAMADARQFRTLAGGAQAAVFGTAATLNAMKNRGTAGDFTTKSGTFT